MSVAPPFEQPVLFPAPAPAKEKTVSPLKHSNNFAARMGRWSASHWKTAVFGWLAFVVASFVIGNAVGTKYLETSDTNVGEARQADKIIEAGFPQTNDEMGEIVLIQSKTLNASDPAFKAVIVDVTKTLDAFPQVTKLDSPLDTGHADLVSKDGRSVMVTFSPKGDYDQALTYIATIEAAVDKAEKRHPGFSVEELGSVTTERDVNAAFNSMLAKAGMIAIPLTLVILLLVFGSFVAAPVPLLLAITAVFTTTALIAIPSQFIPVDESIAEVILLIGLAVGIDYSLFYLRREREERAAGRSEGAALEAAAATSGRAVLISGATVIVAMAGMFISGDKTFISFAMGTIIVVAIAVFASLTVLPAMLSWLGDRVEKGRVPILGNRRRGVGESRFWSSLTGGVMRRPGLSLLLAGGVLVALAIPALGMKSVTSDIDELPGDLPVIQTYNKVKKIFPAEGVTAVVVMEVDDVTAGGPTTGIAALINRVDASPKFFKPGTELIESKDGTVAQINIPTVGSGTDQASLDALSKLRDDIVPATVGAVEGATVNVSGNAAQSADFASNLEERLPLIFAFVFGLAFLLMLVTFRSIVIPITAILLNLLSVGAAYGVLVLVFQNGNGESLIGFSSNGGVANWLPLFLFVVLFGLSMDYHVFILSRVRELYDRGMTTDEAVKQGISTTAGTVTSAAAVMVGVFLVFVTLSFIDFKELGLGLAAAVLIDATIIRGVLLPASMKLLGDWNWYLPSWLEWLPRIGGDGEPAAPATEPPAPPVAEEPEPFPV